MSDESPAKISQTRPYRTMDVLNSHLPTSAKIIGNIVGAVWALLFYKLSADYLILIPNGPTGGFGTFAFDGMLNVGIAWAFGFSFYLVIRAYLIKRFLL